MAFKMNKSVAILLVAIVASFAAGLVAGIVLWHGEVGTVSGSVKPVSGEVTVFSIEAGELNASSSYVFHDTFSARADKDSTLTLWVNDSSVFDGIESWNITIRDAYAVVSWTIDNETRTVSGLPVPAGGWTEYFVDVYIDTGEPSEVQNFSIRVYATLETTD